LGTHQFSSLLNTTSLCLFSILLPLIQYSVGCLSCATHGKQRFCCVKKTLGKYLKLNRLKLTKRVQKITQNLTSNNLYCLLPIKKSFEVKSKFDHHVHSRSYQFFLNSLIILWRCFRLWASYMTKCTCETISFFPAASMYDIIISYQTHGFRTSFSFSRI
jgi:hypothetical protein